MTNHDTKLRKPCIALMGEFSAGKSTLANLLIGSDPLPIQVIATQLPPVWITFGNEPPYRTDLSGERFSVDLDDLAAAPIEDTSYIKIFCEEDIFLHCDLLDMPGISDPNMPAEVWQRMISKADGVLWCSHATQAWRQSEAAVWASLPSDLYRNSLLLLTRVDKLTSERDRQKVIRRVCAETEGLFLDCLPISLLQATTEQDDYEAWCQSGAGEFAKQFANLLHNLSADAELLPQGTSDGEAKPLSMPGFEGPQPPAHAEPLPEDMTPRVVPRRVRLHRR